MKLERSVEYNAITDAGTEFHDDSEIFFDNVDVDKAYKLLNKNRKDVHDYFVEILGDGLYSGKFADFQIDRLIIFNDNRERWFPIHRELTLERPDIGLAGTIDSVEYLDTESDDNVLVEYKSGSLNKWRVPKLRRELAVYKLLIEGTSMIKKPIEHIGAFCASNDPYWEGIFFEKIHKKTITSLIDVIKEIRTTFEKAYKPDGTYDLSYFPKDPSAFCMLCSYSETCYEEMNK